MRILHEVTLEIIHSVLTQIANLREKVGIRDKGGMQSLKTNVDEGC